jgi:transcriptional regulator GlxA family with amidase domain
VDPGLVDGCLARRLDQELAGAADEREALATLNRELVRLLDGLQPDPAVREAVSLLQQPSRTVSEIAGRVFISQRQLERRFVEHVGYGPKTLQRILRLQQIVTQLSSKHRAVELARTAASCGYADQSHLSRETRRLTGLSPRQLAQWIG